jgi:DNA-directed RNA polymerase specialized sigma subunit
VTASEYLGQVEVLNVRIDQKRKELERIQNEAYGVKGMRYDTDRVQTSPVDHMPDMVIRCIELESEIQKDIERNIEFRHRIIYQIQGMPDLKHVQLLYKKYVELKTNPEIAGEMNMAEDTVRKIHTKALQEFTRVYGQRSFVRIKPSPPLRRMGKKGSGNSRK